MIWAKFKVLVEGGYITEEDFKAFTFGKLVDMHTAMNPNFFKGVAVEDDVAKHMAQSGAIAAE